MEFFRKHIAKISEEGSNVARSVVEVLLECLIISYSPLIEPAALVISVIMSKINVNIT